MPLRPRRPAGRSLERNEGPRGAPRGDLHGHAATVQLHRLELGDLKLEQGSNPIAVTVFGKPQASKGFLVGLDRVELTPK